MTKIIAILFAVLLIPFSLFTLPISGEESLPHEETVDTEETEDIHEMTGVVLEVTDTYYIIETADGQQVQVNVYEDTLYEGQDPAAGDLIHILYNGMMTRSLPPQINAMRIGCYVRTGAVVELTETGFTLDDGAEIIEVHVEPELLAGIETGDSVVVYFNGAMTMSLPAQIGAEMILAIETIVD